MRSTVFVIVGIGLMLSPGGCSGAEPRKDTARQATVALDSYVTRDGRGSVPGVTENASGLAYSPDTGNLYAVVNAPAEIVEFTRLGKKLRTIRLHGFADTEAITYVASNTFAVVEEGRGAICVLALNATTTVVTRDSIIKEIKVDRTDGNQGLEGVAYDPESRSFYCVKEKGPKRVYRVNANGQISHPWDAEKDALHLKDLSDIYFHVPTGHLIILSDESSTAVECTTDGREVSRLRLRFRQAEGITMDDKGNLYVCGEPSEFERFRKAE